MGKKRTQRKPTNNSNNKHANASFQDLVAQAVNSKLLNTVNQQMNYLASLIAQEQRSNLEDIYSRLNTLESLCLEKFGLTDEEFAILVAETEDKLSGFIAGEIVEEGDLVRLEIATRTKEQEEFQGSTRTKLQNAGSTKTFGEEIESAIIGMKVNETKEIEFGKDKGMVAKVTIQTTSRAPIKEETKEESNENKDA
jgi:hypothetical protein